MSDQQKRSTSRPGQTKSWAAGVPSCLWFLLGGGSVVVLIGLGLLLAWIPTSREAALPIESRIETTAQTQVSLPEPTFTLSASSAATPTPPTGLDYLEGGSNPDVLLLVTPSSISGVLSFSPYLNADAGNFQLEPGQILTLKWEDFPPGALYYHFTLQPHSGESSLTIGIDSDPADEVEVEWLVPENIAGDLHGFAIYEDGRVVSAGFAGALYSGSADGSSPVVNVLKEYFRSLNIGDYQAAAALYGGDYSILEDNNPDLDPADRASLFQHACQFNGFVCLPVAEVVAVEPGPSASFEISVRFQNPDGSLFSRGACCGDPSQEEPETEFTFRVAKDSRGRFLVMDLPVYVP